MDFKAKPWGEEDGIYCRLFSIYINEDSRHMKCISPIKSAIFEELEIIPFVLTKLYEPHNKISFVLLNRATDFSFPTAAFSIPIIFVKGLSLL